MFSRKIANKSECNSEDTSVMVFLLNIHLACSLYFIFQEYFSFLNYLLTQER